MNNGLFNEIVSEVTDKETLASFKQIFDQNEDIELKVGTIITNSLGEEIAKIRHTREEIELAFEEDPGAYNETTYFEFLMVAGETISTATDEDRMNFWVNTEAVMMEIDTSDEGGSLTILGDSLDSAGMINYTACVYDGLDTLEEFNSDIRIRAAKNLINIHEEKLKA